MSERQKPRHAATVILLRQVQPAGFEVFLTRRPEGMAFLGGMYCFPGGTVRKEDYSPALLGRCYGLTPNQARKIVGAHFSPEEALGFWIAGIRELFEEVGILLAVDESGGHGVLESNRQTLAETRAALLNKSMDFASVLETQELRCDAPSLAYFSHWQTPSQQSMRFDTRFFLASLPQNQSPVPTSPEVSHSVWLSPDRALQLSAKNELPMIFPTFASLRTLADFDSLENLFREYHRQTGMLTPLTRP